MSWQDILKETPNIHRTNDAQMRLLERREEEVREMRDRDKQHNSGQTVTPDGKPAKPPLAPVSQRLKEAFGEQELSSQQQQGNNIGE